MLPRLSDRVGGAGGAGHREPMGCHSPWGTLASPAVGKGEGLILGAGRVGLSHCPCPGIWVSRMEAFPETSFQS